MYDAGIPGFVSRVRTTSKDSLSASPEIDSAFAVTVAPLLQIVCRSSKLVVSKLSAVAEIDSAFVVTIASLQRIVCWSSKLVPSKPKCLLVFSALRRRLFAFAHEFLYALRFNILSSMCKSPCKYVNYSNNTKHSYSSCRVVSRVPQSTSGIEHSKFRASRQYAFFLSMNRE